MSGMMTPSDTERMNQYGEMAILPETSLKGYVGYVESIPEQRPERVAEAVVGLVEIPFGEKPFRTVVDYSGLKQPIENYNKVLNETTKAIYAANGVENLLTLNKD